MVVAAVPWKMADSGTAGGKRSKNIKGCNVQTSKVNTIVLLRQCHVHHDIVHHSNY